MALKRLNKELQKVREVESEQFSVMLEGDDIHKWTVMMVGPSGTPYEGGLFHVSLEFPPEYPFKPPKVSFKTKIYHPNIKSTGEICADSINESWGPTRNVLYILQVLESMLKEPNGASPLEAEIGKKFNENRAEFNEIARKWTAEYAQ